MEELRSTDVLDKEIQTDARKKAERILSKSETDGKAIIDGVASRIAAAKAERGAAYQKKIDAFEKDKNASLPLEKQRFLVSFIEAAVIKGINGYLESLSQRERLALVMSRYGKYRDILGSKRVNVHVFGFNPEDVKKTLAGEGLQIASCSQIEYEKSGDDPVEGLAVKEGAIIETEDGMIRCRLTIAQIVGELERDHRAELSDALFGGRLS